MISARVFLIAAAAVASLCAVAFADADEDAGIVLYKRSEALLQKDRARKEAIGRCASCHPDVYAQWKKGPHAHSFENFARSIRDAIGAVEGLSKRQRRKKIKLYKQYCVECHAPSNLVYEESVPADWDGVSRLRYEDFGGDAWLELTSGVDCVTCHAKGDRVVTRPDYAPPEGFTPPQGFCDPIPSRTFAHIYNCVSCHTKIVEDYADRFSADPARREPPYLSCEQCHLERDAQGKGTHYYYWSANPKKIERLIRPMFDRMTIEVGRDGGKRKLSVRWATDFLPHALLPDTPKLYRLIFAVLDGKGETVLTKELRIYDPTQESGRNEESVRPSNPTGELVSIEKSGTLEKSYDLPDSIGDSGSVQLTVFKKSEYKNSDAEAVEVYRRTEKF